MAVKKTAQKKVKKKIENLPAKIEPISIPVEIISNLVLHGNIGQMTAMEKVKYYQGLCCSLGLNPLTQPFQIITLQGKEVLYATKTATEQLRKIYGVSVGQPVQSFHQDICITTVTVTDKTGRTDGATGAVNIAGLKGDALANAIMKSETKAKRRATLSICGLGMLDESEIETIPGAAKTIKSIMPEPERIPEPIKENINIDELYKKATNFIESSQTVKQLTARGTEFLNINKIMPADKRKILSADYNRRMTELMAKEAK